MLSQREPVIETLPEYPIESRDLQLLASNGDEAKAAFDRLWLKTVDATRRQALAKGVAPADVEDVLQQVFIKLWRLRYRIRAKTMGEWYALVRKATVRTVNGRRRVPLQEVGEEYLDIPRDEVPYLDALLNQDDRFRLYEAANDLWLGKGDKEAEVMAAAIQLVLIDGLDPSDVARMFALDTQDFDRWLTHSTALTWALYAALCWPSDGLANYVLGASPPLPPDELDDLTNARIEPKGELQWSGVELRAVLLRVRKAFQEDQLKRRLADLDSEGLERVLDRLRDTYPFPTIAEAVRERLEGFDRAGSLKAPGLWRRIAFEYHTILELPHKQILERAASAADESGFCLNKDTLNNWFGLGRLWAQLAAYVANQEALNET